jgi:hypothetical protein
MLTMKSGCNFADHAGSMVLWIALDLSAAWASQTGE